MAMPAYAVCAVEAEAIVRYSGPESAAGGGVVAGRAVAIIARSAQPNQALFSKVHESAAVAVKYKYSQSGAVLFVARNGDAHGHWLIAGERAIAAKERGLPRSLGPGIQGRMRGRIVETVL